MEYCPTFVETDPFSPFMVSLDCLTIVCFLFNTYLIYCIIYRSTSQMKVYRWYLLWHQGVTITSDFSVNLLVRPIFFMPFLAGYPAGLLRRFVSTPILAASVLFISLLSLASVIHLFIYRYLIITQRRKYPWIYVFRVGLPYLLSVITGIQEYRAHIDEKIVIDRYKNKYSCVGDYLLEIDGFLIFDQDINYQETAAVQTVFFMLFVFETSYCTYFSFRATHLTKMSSHLVILQRKLLIQLLVQTLVPFAVLCLPMFAVVLVMRFHYYSLSFVGSVIVACFGSFSLIGGITLIAMIPTYQTPTRKWLQKALKGKVAPKQFATVPSQTLM